jgi:8-oxo-dGTP diphosphatase
MPRHTRYQGAIIENHHILLIQHREHASGRSYWVIPGGGIEPGETEAECVKREMKEETHLDVAVERLILDEPDLPGEVYKVRKTFLCRPIGGEARPGSEPEPQAANAYAISEVRWFDMRQVETWNEDLRRNQITFRQVLKIRDTLGYT